MHIILPCPKQFCATLLQPVYAEGSHYCLLQLCYACTVFSIFKRFISWHQTKDATLKKAPLGSCTRIRTISSTSSKFIDLTSSKANDQANFFRSVHMTCRQVFSRCKRARARFERRRKSKSNARRWHKQRFWQGGENPSLRVHSSLSSALARADVLFLLQVDLNVVSKASWRLLFRIGRNDYFFVDRHHSDMFHRLPSKKWTMI